MRPHNDVYTRDADDSTPPNCLDRYVPDTLLYCAVSGSRTAISYLPAPSFKFLESIVPHFPVDNGMFPLAEMLERCRTCRRFPRMTERSNSIKSKQEEGRCARLAGQVEPDK